MNTPMDGYELFMQMILRRYRRGIQVGYIVVSSGPIPSFFIYMYVTRAVGRKILPVWPINLGQGAGIEHNTVQSHV